MVNIFRKLNQLYYLIYTLIILLTIIGYFLNLNNLINIRVAKLTENILQTLQYIFSFVAFAYFVYFLMLTSKLKDEDLTENSKKRYLKFASIRLLLIGISLILGVVCFYLLRSLTILYPVGVMAVLLLLSKPVEVKINEMFTK